MELDTRILSRAERLELELRRLYLHWGYAPYKMSKFEPYDLYASNRSFVVGNRMLTFTDTGGTLMALKPDVTLSIIKNYRGGQRKVCYHESVYRDTGSSREFREIMQAGLECIGEIDLYTQYEVLALAFESLRRISGEGILDLASVGVVAALYDITGAEEEDKTKLLRLVHGKNAPEVRRLCRDLALPPEQAEAWTLLAELYGPAEEQLPRLERSCIGEGMREALAELKALCDVLGKGGFRPELDFSIVNDLRYYNGAVFRGYVPGLPEAVLSGGRYDHLVRKLGKNAGAIGFAVYLDLVEQLPGDAGPCQPEVLLRYGESTPPDEVMAKAKAMREEGKTVLVYPDTADSSPAEEGIEVMTC